MALVKTMNATVVTGEYQSSQGETKKSYMTIGTLFIYDDGGMSLKLDALPLGNGNISFYDKKPKEAQQGQPQQNYNQSPKQAYQPSQQQSYQQQPQQDHREYRQSAQQKQMPQQPQGLDMDSEDSIPFNRG